MSELAITQMYKVQVRAIDEKRAKAVIKRQYPEAEIYFARPQKPGWWVVVFEMDPIQNSA